MISSAPASKPVEAVSENVSPVPGSAAVNPAKGEFDAILAMENLAATCNALGAEAMEGVVDGLSEAQTDEEESDTDEDELSALEFLAALLNTPTPFRSQAAGAQSRGESADGAGALASGTGRGSPEPALSLAEAMDSTMANDSADKLLTLAQAATAAEGLTTPLDGAVDSAAHLARGAELPGTRQTASAERAAITTPMRDPRWAEDFGTRISTMVRGGESQASLQLSPVDLGPMDVSVTVRDSQASIHFGAAQAETRALIEASIPRLREMLAAQGFNLMDASVSQGFSRQSQQGRPDAGAGALADAESEAIVTRVTAAGLLDLYA